MHNKSMYYFNKSISEMDIKNYKKALQYVNKAIKIDSNMAEAYYLRSQIYDLKGKDKYLSCKDLYKAASLDYQPAKEAYKEWCYEMPIVEFNYLLDEFETYIKKYPNRYQGYYDRGNLYYSNRMYEKAIEDYNKVLEIKEYPSIYFLRGLCFMKLKQFDKGCPDIKKADSLGHIKAKEALKFCKCYKD